jgi:UDP-3-O-[3-hydroxymyristoyl] N-acetylglucosamine deacetylase
MVKLITNGHGAKTRKKQMINISQKTINNKISCNSVGLHSGEKVNMTLLPAPCNSGIIFRRIDVEEGKNEVKASYQNVVSTNLGTTIANEHGTKVLTVEHLMAAIWGSGIDNLIVELDGQEIPIMDGSSKPFIFLIECAGIQSQEAQRKIIEIMKNIRVEDGDKFVEVEPAKEFALDLEIEFQNKKIGKQNFSYRNDLSSFKNDISGARTFCLKEEIEHMNKLGLAKGGSLNNAIVVDGIDIVNKNGLRYENEFVRHKTLDFIGDIYLANHYIIGHFKASKAGHGINNAILRKIFSDQENWRLV